MENERKPYDTPWEVVESEKMPGNFNIYGKSGNQIMAYGDEGAMRVAAACVNAQALYLEEYYEMCKLAAETTKNIKELSDKINIFLAHDGGLK